MRDLIILLVIFVAMMVLGCDSSTSTSYGSGSTVVKGDNNTVGNKTPAPVVVPPVVVVP